MEQESTGEAPITGQDLEAKILKLKKMKEMLDQQKMNLSEGRFEQYSIHDELDALTKKTKKNLHDAQKPVSGEVWIELWQREKALETNLSDLEAKVTEYDKNYRQALNDAEINDRRPNHSHDIIN